MQPSGAPTVEWDQFARDWAADALTTQPRSEAERAAVIEAIRRCYAHAGVSWPDRVLWAPSPPAGQRLADDLARRHTPAAVRLRTAARVCRSVLVDVITFGLLAAAYCAGLTVLLMSLLPGDPLRTSHETASDLPHGKGGWIGGVAGGLVLLAVIVGLSWTYVRDLYEDTFGVVDVLLMAGAFAVAAGFLAIALFVVAALGIVTGLWLSGVVGEAGPPSGEWIRTLLVATLAPVVGLSAVLGAVNGVDRTPRYFHDPAHDRLNRRRDRAVREVQAAGPAPDDHVRDAVEQSVGAVGRSIEPPERFVARRTSHRSSGRWEFAYHVGHFGDADRHRLAGVSWQAAGGAPVPAAAGTVVGDFVAAARAGWWWPHSRFVVIGERPSILRVESGRLHDTDGPAAEWPDGHRIYAVHGTVVPADLVERGWSVAQIHAHPNTEVRRAAIELMGWATYIRRTGWRLVAQAPDPGNRPHKLSLYADPEERMGVRVLTMTNGSPDRNGRPRRYAEAVPDWMTDPVEAAAWQYDCPVDVYRQLRRRT